MKVTVYDEQGVVIGVAWHEDDHGYVELPPATRECVAMTFAINDGPQQMLTSMVRVPVDEVLKLRIRDLNEKAKPPQDYFERIMREAFRGEDVTDSRVLPTPFGWWGKIKRWFNG